MSADDLGHIEIEGDGTELVPAVFARDPEEAQRYCELLADHGIVGIIADDGVGAEDAQARIGAGEGVGMTRGVAVLVEDALLDEAGMVISDREDPAEFQFCQEDEDEDEDDDVDFGQGLDSDFDDSPGPPDVVDMLASDPDGFDDDDEEEDDDEFGEEFDDELDDELDED